MKKLFIAASLIIGMIAGAMVLSSFSEPKQEIKKCEKFSITDGWRKVGTCKGECEDCTNKISVTFHIWEKDGMCNAYYWVFPGIIGYDKLNPDEVDSNFTGALRQNNDGKWYAMYDGKKYYIDF